METVNSIQTIDIKKSLQKSDTTEYTPPENLIFAADGVLGISHIGALIFLRKKIPLFQQSCINFAGSSIGSIWALLLSCNISLETILNISIQILNDLYDSFENLSTNNMHLYFGLTINNWKVLENELTKIFNTNEPITFKMHNQKFKNNLVISGFNLTKSKIEYFNHVSNPNLNLIDAIRISTCIPFLFSPISFNDYIYIDPIIRETIPLNYFIINNIDLNYDNTYIFNNVKSHQIENRIEVSNNLNNLQEYTMIIFKNIMYSFCSYTCNLELNLKYLNISIHNPSYFLNNISYESFHNILNIGYKSMERYF